MKRVLIACALSMWTLMIVAATVLWMLTGRGVRVVSGLLSDRRPVSVRVGRTDQLAQGQWMLSSRQDAKGDEIHVKRQDLTDAGLRVIIDDWSGFSWDTVTIELHHLRDGSFQATARVDWHRDVGPPFAGTFQDLTGTIGLSHWDWQDARPLVIDFELHGLEYGQPSCVHGEVSVPN